MPFTQKSGLFSSIESDIRTSKFANLFSVPWVCELHSLSSTKNVFNKSQFCSDVTRLLDDLKLSGEIYSFGTPSNVAKLLSQFKSQSDPLSSLENSKKRPTTIICVDDIWEWNPISLISPFLCCSSITEQLIFRLRSANSHIYVKWDLLTKGFQTSHFKTKIATFDTKIGRDLLKDMFCLTQRSDEIKLLLKSLVDIAFTLDVSIPNLDGIMKRSNPSMDDLLSIAAAIFSPICKSQKLEYLSIIELTLGVAEAVQNEKLNEKSTRGFANFANLSNFLQKYENTLMLAHIEDQNIALSNDCLKQCRPILLNAIQEASKLNGKSNAYFAIVKLLHLLPSQGCDPAAKSNQPIINAIDNLLKSDFTDKNVDDMCLKLEDELLSNINNYSIGRHLLASAYKRHTLPAYRENVQNFDFPQMRSPILQLFSDLSSAHNNAALVKPALQSLQHWPVSNSSESFFGGMGKWIGRGLQSGVPHPYDVSVIVLVLGCSISWSLARDIVIAASKSASTCKPLEVLIICDSLLTCDNAAKYIIRSFPAHLEKEM